MASKSTLTYTSIDEIEKVHIHSLVHARCLSSSSDSGCAFPALQIHARARAAFESGKAASLAFRKEQIAQLAYLLRDNEDRLRDALRADLGRPPLETDLCVPRSPSFSTPL